MGGEVSLNLLHISHPNRRLYEEDWFGRVARNGLVTVVPEGKANALIGHTVHLPVHQPRVGRLLGSTASPVRYRNLETVYQGQIELQAMWQTVGGFDETLTAAEDWDLALRMADSGARTGRTTSCIWHDEHKVGYLVHCAKKAHYAEGLQRFMDIYGYRGRQLLLDRPYLRRPWRLLRHPVLGAGLFILKLGEAASVGAVLASRRIGGHGGPTPGRGSRGVP